MTSKKKSTEKKENIKVKPSASDEMRSEFLVVGIGASAGGLEAFKEFFAAMPDDSGMAFIIIQHLDPTHKSLLSDILSKSTKMSVREVEDGFQVEPNKVYIIPPNKYMAILNGTLQLLNPIEERGNRRPIDFFLKSLAIDQKEKQLELY